MASSATLDLAERHCQQHGLRLTSKRRRVLQRLLEAGQALSAYELINACKDDFGAALAPTSMYRILEFLEDKKLIHKLSLANKYIACVNGDCPEKEQAFSQFLICSNCSRVVEVEVDPAVMAALMATVRAKGFELQTPQLELNCLCEQCSAELHC